MAREIKSKPAILPSAEIWRDGLWHPVGGGPVAAALNLVAADDRLHDMTGFQMERIERIMRWCYEQGRIAARQPAQDDAQEVRE